MAMGRRISREPIGVGVIGAGAMGMYHVRTLMTSVPDARLLAVHDADPDRARQAAALFDGRMAPSVETLIGDVEVEAILVASPDPTHAGLVLGCLAAGKPVLCEKPLSTELAAAQRVIEAEVASGRRSVQLGFMRRYDPAFVELRRTVQSGEIGLPRIVHCVHRNPSPYPGITARGIVRNSMIHELDALRWILGAEITSIRIETAQAVEDPVGPQLATIRIGADILASVEISVNARYGYDVRCEVLGEQGSASLVPPAIVRTQTAGAETVRVSSGFVARFGDAYLAQLRDWVDGVRTATARGPSAWDGFMAEVVAGAAVEALTTGHRQLVPTPDRPDLYA